MLGVLGAGLAVGYALYERASFRQEKARALELAERRADTEARPVLERCLERDPHDRELLKALTEVLIRSAASLLEIEQYLNRWREVDPDGLDPWLTIARFYYAVNRYDDALPAAERSLVIAPENNEARTIHAMSALQLGRWEAATASLRRLDAARAEVPVRLLLAKAESERGNQAEALEAVTAELLVQPQSYEAIALRATIHFRSSDYEAALEWFRKCAPRTPRERELTLFHIGQCLQRLNRQEEFRLVDAELQELQSALNLNVAAELRKDDSTLQLRAARAWLAVKEPASAEKIIRESIRRFGPTRENHLLQAACLEAMGRPADAEQIRRIADSLPR